MKYLKLFESKSISYWEISNTEWVSQENDESKYDNFSEGERGIISSIFKNSHYGYELLKSKYDNIISYKSGGQHPRVLGQIVYGSAIKISKFKDEWYSIKLTLTPPSYHMKFIYYKCDQQDGLTDFLKKILK
jgi:hypothetical protein